MRSADIVQNNEASNVERSMSFPRRKVRKQPVVLVTDDNRGMRSAMRICLHDFSYRVVELQDGLGVLRVCNESDVPIMFVSGHDREEFRNIATQLP